MITPSNEILDERFKTMEKQNKVEHGEIKDLLTTLSSKIDDLEKKYVTRLEFKAVSIAIGTVATVLGVIGMIKGFTS